MKRKKLALSISGLVLLGVGIVIIPNLKNGLNSLKSLNWFQLGGAHKTRREIRGDDYKLKIDNDLLDPSSKLTFDKGSIKLPNLRLDGSKDSNRFSFPLNDSFLWRQFDSDYIGSIKSIFGEITKEDVTGSIESRTRSEYVSLVKQHLGTGGQDPKTLLKNFQDAKSIIETWKSSDTREAGVKALTPQQRQSLKKFYQLYDALNKEKKKFVTELSDVSKGSIKTTENQTTSQTPPVASVTQSLRIVAWDNNNTRMSPSEIKKNSWDKWDNKNPFKPFYEKEEEFKKDLESVNSREQMVNQQLVNSRIERGTWGWSSQYTKHYQEQERQLAEAKKNSSGAIQFRIGSKLLEWMGQLSK